MRLQAAKTFQRVRIERVRDHWHKSRLLREEGFSTDMPALDAALNHALQAIDHIAKANATVLCLQAGTHFELTVRRSFADYLFRWLSAAGD